MLAGALQANPYAIRNTDPLGIWRSAFEAKLKKKRENNRLIRDINLGKTMALKSMVLANVVEKTTLF